ncbi:hypothetical protein F0562_014223 [Nyssa sinensis]|uniref:BED-type domain-containing protein n=1 Tax=Nyssa sinensis TaxID=561372 RepID=A0A5J4ZS36_9ASTE|nr:hypothetical protein F0562_014223 [Nyssa sinensis]
MMYGTYESAASNGSRNGYGLGLSSRDINIVECKNCFGQLMGETDNCCKGKTGWRILAPSCKIRYEQYLFFQQPLAQPLPAAQPLPNNEGKGGMSTTEIALISISAFTVVAALLGIYLYCSLGRKRTETVQENSQEILLNNMEGQNSKHFMEESMHEQSDEHIIEQSSSTTSKRKRTTSKVWDNFEKLSITADGKQKASCKKCKQEYIADAKSGTSNLLRHLTCCPKGVFAESMAQATFQVDQDIYREKISTAIIRHNYPFMFVEHEGIRDFHSFLNPTVKPITRNTAKFDVLKLYKREKDKLKHVIESIPSRICLTSDLWSSIATDGYLALTAHYVDENWILQKKILSFHHMPPPHSGPILVEKVIHLLKEWGIEKKVFSLTLDNAKYNDGLIDVLKRHLSLTDTLFCGGEFFHVRCGAHILNLIVQAGLKVIDEAVNKIRESVKYVRGSEGRKIKFAECIAQLSLSCSKKVCQDVPTRWNYTYLMIDGALMYRRVFDQLQLIDVHFKTCPSDDE